MSQTKRAVRASLCLQISLSHQASQSLTATQSHRVSQSHQASLSLLANQSHRVSQSHQASLSLKAPAKMTLAARTSLTQRKVSHPALLKNNPRALLRA